MAIEFGSPASAVPGSELELSALVQRVDSNSIRDFIALSEKIPILLLFVQEADSSSKSLESSVTALVQKSEGSIIALVVDVAASPELAQAFEVEQIPSLYGLLKGQPAPLFAGNQPVEQIQLVINKVLEVAKENGLTSRAKVTEVPNEIPLSPTLQSAYGAIDQGHYQQALDLYEKALLENPNDSLAEAGLAQVKLLLRLENKDLDQLAAGQGQELDSILVKADALIATGMSEKGLSLLLELFERTPKDQREPIRLRLLELFLVVGNDHQHVVAARKALSLLLF